MIDGMWVMRRNRGTVPFAKSKLVANVGDGKINESTTLQIGLNCGVHTILFEL